MTAAALAVFGCWIDAMVDALPPREAVDWQRRGEVALQRGDLTNAERLFERVLERAPRSTRARRGIACALWASGRHGAAAIVVALALQDGMPLSGMTCGRWPGLAQQFTRHVATVPVVFVLPRNRSPSPAAAEALRTVATPISPDGWSIVDGRRMLAAACVAWQARWRELAFEYAKLGESWGAGRPELRRFLDCIGPKLAAEIECSEDAEHLGECRFRVAVLRGMEADRRYGEI